MPRYAPAERLDRLRALLRTGPCTVQTMMERLDISESTARRLLAALERAGEPLVEEGLDGRKAWKLLGGTREHPVRLTTAQLLALLVARNGAREILRGTGFDDDLDAACTALTDTLPERDAALVKDLDRKIHDRGEMAIDHAPYAEVLDEFMTALLKNERLEIRRRGSDGAEKTHLFDPYSLVTCKKGFYLVGLSHDRGQRISLGIDGVIEATRRRGDTFAYPDDYDPAAMFKDAIGVFTGPITKVVLRFRRESVRYVTRRRLHETQRTIAENEDGSIDVALDVASTPELENLILSYGERVEVLAPKALRERIAESAKRAAGQYVE